MDRSPLMRLLNKVNLPLLLWTVLLVAYGTLMAASATSGMDGGAALVKRHVVGVAIGVGLLCVTWTADYKRLRLWVGPISAAGVLLLVAVFVPGFGASAHGAQSWLRIAGVRLFQPSEPAKLVLIIVFAAAIARREGKMDSRGELLRVLGWVAVPLGLVLLQPDLGTALVFIAITAGMLLVGGAKPRHFAMLGLVGLVAFALVLAPGILPRKFALKPYQRNRLMVFIDPSVDPKGAGYNLNQAKIAIGSGGLFGKGLESGTQSNLNFLPERHTDFIFAVVGEELGFAGAVALLALYLALLITALEISTSSRDYYGALVAAGLMSMWTFQVLVNIGMTLGIMPITGIPLPFMSFGSSFMVTNLAGIGLLLSIWARRYGT